MPQFLRPNSDITTGAWVTTPLFSKVNETTSNDSPFIESPTGSNTTCDLGLSTASAPTSGTRTLRIRTRKGASGGNTRGLNYNLKEGSTSVQSGTVDSNLTDTMNTFSITITGSVTDYSNLSLELSSTGTVTGAGTARRTVEVSWVEFEIPDAPAVFDITGATTTPMQVGAGTATFVAGAASYDITGAVTTPMQVGSGTMDFVKPIYEINGGTTIPIQSVSGGAEFVKPIYDVNGGVTTPFQIVSSTASFGAPSYDLSGGVTTPTQEVSGTSAFVKPIYEASGSVNTPMQLVGGTITTGSVTGLQAAYWDGSQFRQGVLKVYSDSEWKNVNLQQYKNGQWH